MALDSLKRMLRRRAAWLLKPIYRARGAAEIRRSVQAGAFVPEPKKMHHFEGYEPATPGRTIPKLLHQTWKNADLPARFQQYQQSAQQMHPAPEWTYRLWTDDAMEPFVREHFGPLLENFYAMPRHIMRVDTFRYMVLYVQGGVYADLDVRFLKPVDAMIADCALLLPAETDDTGQANFLGQHFMAACPGHALWLDCVNEILDRPIEEVRAYIDPIDTTGPEMVTRVWSRGRDGYRAKVAMRVAFAPPSAYRDLIDQLPKATVCVHECAGSWR